MDKQPQPWPPYNTKDCSLGYCSYYCPQYCFFYFPPPAPTPPKLPTHHLLSPLLISVIAISSTALVFIAYYLILSRYRADQGLSSGPPDPAHPTNWPVSHQNGLGETLINKIAIHRYRAGGCLALDGSDCSVCLSRFEDGNDVRLLPKCGHVFHVPCIDTWLKCHSSCPLCRADIFPEPACNNSGDSSIDIVVAHVETQELELDEVVENVNIGDRRRAIGRSLSMDSSFRRSTSGDANTDVDVISSRWNRSLHSVISPVRMKRASSMRSMVEIGRSTLLPT